MSAGLLPLRRLGAVQGWTFDVEGDPQPKGSWKAMPKGRMRPDNSKEPVWAAIVRANALSRLGRPIWTGAIEMDLTFRVRKPPSAKRDKPTVKPDLDKLVRSVLDALTDVLYAGDQQVTTIVARKIYAEGKPGVTIAIRRDLT